jgi:hypothetical protein
VNLQTRCWQISIVSNLGQKNQWLWPFLPQVWYTLIEFIQILITRASELQNLNKRSRSVGSPRF